MNAERDLCCVICGRRMVELDHEGVRIDACPAGDGCWLDKGEMLQVTHAERLPTDPAARERELSLARNAPELVVAAVSREADRSCPVCDAVMHKHDYPGSAIVLDTCEAHGYWLDRDELRRLEAFAEGMRDLASVDERVEAGEQVPGEQVRPIPIPPSVLDGLAERIPDGGG